MSKLNGGFTLPGEAGYEGLTLELAKRWGADVIRDSDGTVLSDDILNAGYGIYSTICIIRDHNKWAKENKDKLQQTFLITSPVVAEGNTLTIELLKDYFKEQFSLNDKPEAMEYWQVYDRTVNKELPAASWKYDKANGTVTLSGITPFHKYTVSFLAYRIWEEISMYNHTTNHWDKEHLMQIDPRYPETREYLLSWMKNWCETHPATNVVRFTSMFYNFAWIWGASVRNPHLFSDWASYDFTVSDIALKEFAEKYGYRLTAEDFVNGGKYHVTHMPGNKRKADWMEFTNEFVISFGKKLIDIVHEYGKKAYVFYDDSWVGVEPYNGKFGEFGFDGLIKCVFSGYEVRLCAGVPVETHELRLHPYLFPVGLGGAPTFMEGGNPTLDAKKYWISIRRALLRAKIDRIGLGGYLHLVEGFPDFVDYIEKISDEFRTVRDLHSAGKPYEVPVKVAVLTYWGKLRSWTLSGHFHETYMHELIHINEALSGLPVDVKYINFEDVKNGALKDVDLVINAGRAGSAWSGGDAWADEKVLSALTEWVSKGGVFLGVNEPSAAAGFDTFFTMSHVLGVDMDLGDRVCHGHFSLEKSEEYWVPADLKVPAKDFIYLTDESTRVLKEENGKPVITTHPFGKGRGIYMAGFEVNDVSKRMLLDLILDIAGDKEKLYITDNYNCECAFYPGSDTIVVINNSDTVQSTKVNTAKGVKTYTIEPYDTIIEKL
ncbi:MAG: 1,3-beta-galactosyl-N-acetylhexosamine phosphorylase [Lachnospiraceae bacterium]|nr:1,3-beta-galactosyl-N-acetylhexosamine phosphorylase [Lachnospiraceae bacterium]